MLKRILTQKKTLWWNQENNIIKVIQFKNRSDNQSKHYLTKKN